MNQDFYQPEKIEAYLRQEMPVGERNQFEQMLTQAPLLRQELELQQDIAEGIAQYRRAQLKARLDNVPVGGTGLWSGAGVKIGALVGAAATLTLVGYLALTSGSESSSTVPTPTETKAPVAASPGTESTAPVASPEQSSEAPELTPVPGGQESSFNRPSSVADAGSKSTVRTPLDRPAVNNPVEVRENGKPARPQDGEETPLPGEENGYRNSGNDQLPDETSAGTPSPDRLPRLVSGSTKGQPRYRFQENDLYLEGNFGQPYHLFQFNDAAGHRQFYLYYSGDFYYLDQNQQETTPLKKITDPARIVALQEYLTK